MKLSILGVEYDYLAAINKAKLQDLYDLKVATGVGPQAIFAMFGRMNKAETLDQQTAVLEEPESLQAVMALAFLCRRSGGEKVTYVDAVDITMQDWDFIPEPGDTSAAEADPTQASGDQSPPDAETTNGEQPKKPRQRRSSSPAT